MNRLDLKYYLVNKEYFKSRIDELKTQQIQAEEINRLVANYSAMPGGSSKVQDRMAESIAKILDYVSDQLDYYIEQLEFQKKIVKILENLSNPIYRDVLYKRYIIGMDLREIADVLHYDFKYITNIHGYALNAFDKICKSF